MSAPLVEVPVASSAPASRPAGRDVPVYSRADVALIIAGGEIEKGKVAKERDEQATRATLAEAYGRKLASELEAAQLRASWVPWTVGAAAFIVGALGGTILGAVLWQRAHQAQPADAAQLSQPALAGEHENR